MIEPYRCQFMPILSLRDCACRLLKQTVHLAGNRFSRLSPDAADARRGDDCKQRARLKRICNMLKSCPAVTTASTLQVLAQRFRLRSKEKILKRVPPIVFFATRFRVDRRHRSDCTSPDNRLFRRRLRPSWSLVAPGGGRRGRNNAKTGRV